MMLCKNRIRRFSIFLLSAIFLIQASATVKARPLQFQQLLTEFTTDKTKKGTAELRPPRVFDVQHYVIRIAFNREKKTVIGDVTVRLKPLAQGLKTFSLDAGDEERFKVESITLENSNTLLTYKLNDEKLQITLDKAYSANDTIGVRIVYQAQPKRGLYFIKQSKTRGYDAPAQIWTQGEPEDNHFWFPCYDYPDDKATTEQFITTQGNELAVGNGALQETKTNIDDTKTFHWKMDVPHVSYLTSLVVGNFVKLEDTYKETPLEYYVYSGSEDLTRRVFAQTPQMMKFFETKFNFPFPYKRYAQTIVNEYSLFAGMENITATTLSDNIILEDDADRSYEAEELISHELAHSWFGNLVTCKDWSHLWLNEGFATFMEAAYREHTEGREAYVKKIRNDAMAYFSSEAYGRRHPLVNKFYGNPMTIFDSTNYQKGGFVIHMLRQTVGEETFWKALNLYLNEYKFKSAETADLQRVFEKVSGKNLMWFFDQWVYKAGFPTLKVSYKFIDKTKRLQLTIEQTQVADDITPTVFRLFADVQIVTDKGTRTEKVEISKRSQTFTFKVNDKFLQVWVDRDYNLLRLLNFPQAQEQMKRVA